MSHVKPFIFAISVIILAGTASAAPAVATKAQVAQILFVCKHGNGKSLLAASYFNRLVKQRDLPFNAIARGVAPDATTVSPTISAALRKDGIDVTGFTPQAVTTADVESSSLVITLGTTLPARAEVTGVPTQEWDDAPTASVDIQGRRQLLKARVESLVEQLASKENR